MHPYTLQTSQPFEQVMQDLSWARYWFDWQIGWHVWSRATSNPVAQVEQPVAVHELQFDAQFTQDLSVARYWVDLQIGWQTPSEATSKPVAQAVQLD